jgi:ribonuclease VapC
LAKVVLDASALLALINKEKGASAVEAAISGAFVSSVNISEVISRLIDQDSSPDPIIATLKRLPIEVVPFDAEQAYESGLLRSATRAAGLSLGDRACLNLATRLKLPALTGDRNWARVTSVADINLFVKPGGEAGT